ncbi:hypothetical protein COZ22_01725 [bacterium (Candidatus Howlettbacteria) CG_4_10_14_3_um_filter_37_10]|nr:MAG: hypothetical protein COX25_05345 [bacterium (Candidatus Howlettbacteria) CG23_combo_of_CG06-09_8_20_14_all_37_9]PIX99767.1 MAG: hypothetical protein COZ22_01725 [bacterium (Candidatus Howlettbacteria) CG_4_10_14_3_um_filter_37_10]PJB06736.1 MAG: hypothetical protein CO123_01435 [bacterium (Candidatus Howlettbacteria) CG_4_9_14_3_um_filter_37_10]
MKKFSRIINKEKDSLISIGIILFLFVAGINFVLIFFLNILIILSLKSTKDISKYSFKIGLYLIIVASYCLIVVRDMGLAKDMIMFSYLFFGSSLFAYLTDPYFKKNDSETENFKVREQVGNFYRIYRITLFPILVIAMVVILVLYASLPLQGIVEQIFSKPTTRAVEIKPSTSGKFRIKINLNLADENLKKEIMDKIDLDKFSVVLENSEDAGECKIIHRFSSNETPEELAALFKISDINQDAGIDEHAIININEGCSSVGAAEIGARITKKTEESVRFNIKIKIENMSDIAGLAASFQDKLLAEDFEDVDTGNSIGESAKSNILYYEKDFEKEALFIKEKLKPTSLEIIENIPSGNNYNILIRLINE